MRLAALALLLLPTIARADEPAAAVVPVPAEASAAHDASAAAAPTEPTRVKVAVYVLNIGKFDVTTGTFTIDFYLDLQSVPKGTDMGDARFEFMNGRAQHTDTLVNEKHEKFYRIQAQLASNVDLHRFPWDTHDLAIILEHSQRPKEELVLEVNPETDGIDPAVIFIGWDLKGSDATIRDHDYPVYKQVFSQYRYTIHIGRLMFISTLKTFLPVLCFILISMVSLLSTLEKLDSRVGMNTAMLIASVLYHLNITNQLPPAGYLTVADKVMVATYITIGLNLFLSVHMMRLMQLKREPEAVKVRELSFKLIPAFAALSYLIGAAT